MRPTRFLLLAFVTLLFLGSSSLLRAQEDDASRTAPDTLGTALLYEFSNDYDVVFKGVKDALTEIGYTVGYASRKRNLVETEFKVLASEENFNDVMDQYGDVPYMRSPGWETGRAKVMVTFEPVDETRTAIKVLAQMSGFEGRFTNQWHYWSSNGKLEREAMDAIIAKLEGGGGRASGE